MPSRITMKRDSSSGACRNRGCARTAPLPPSPLEPWQRAHCPMNNCCPFFKSAPVAKGFFFGTTYSGSTCAIAVSVTNNVKHIRRMLGLLFESRVYHVVYHVEHCGIASEAQRWQIWLCVS